MSRTTRRIKGNRGWSLEWALEDDRLERDYPHLSKEDAKAVVLARHHADGAWNMTTPMWWIREFMTVPARATVRNETRKLVKGGAENVEDFDYTVFPLSRKPHHYYW